MPTARIRQLVRIGFTAALMGALLNGPHLAAAPVPAPTGATAIKARQAGYKQMGTAMKSLNDQLKSGAPSRDIMLGAVRTIATIARGQGALFPAGSGPGAGVPTDALPVIWTDRATFDAQMGKLVAESAKLATIASSGDADAIRAQAKATGAVCAACHRQFRADNG
jgi:cytochrome c556